MPESPQGLVTYAGVRGLLAATFTLSCGVGPSTITLRITPPSSPLPIGGEVVLVYGDTRIAFPDCRVLSGETNFDQRGYQTFTLTLMDGRWRWKYAVVSGEYNVRLGDGEIRQDTLKKPRELAELLFKAIGVDKYDVSRMPNDTLPAIAWDVERADVALSRLCESVGARLCYLPHGRVLVCKAGEGAMLPRRNALDAELQIDASEMPDEVRFIGGRMAWEAFFALEPVALEPSGEVVPLDKASYKPKEHGFENWGMDGTAIGDARQRAAALESVYRWYRIKTPFTAWPIPNQAKGEEIKDLRRILPIHSRRAATRTVMGRKEYLPPLLYGRYTEGHEITDEELKRFTTKPKVGSLVTESFLGDFAIDVELGIVKFSSPVYLRKQIKKAGAEYYAQAPAELTLLTAYSLRDNETRGWVREELTREVKDKPKGKRTSGKRTVDAIVRNDVECPLWLDGTSGKWTVKQNRMAFAEQANYYIDQHLAAKRQNDPATATYAGFIPIEPDGAIAQVSWLVGQDGHAYTRASRNREEAALDQTFEQRRVQDRMLELMEGFDKEKTKGARRG